jgi:hypothetical protein
VRRESSLGAVEPVNQLGDRGRHGSECMADGLGCERHYDRSVTVVERA